MRKHLSDGELRASLDGELESAQFTHLAACPECQARQRQIQAQSQQTAHRLAFLAPADELAPATRTAWSRFSQRLLTQKETSMIKRWFAIPMVRFAAAAILFLTLILAFPSTRALADELLNLFRVQQVTVIPVDFTGLEQLTGNDALGSQLSELISSSTETTLEPGDPVEAADAEEASELAGFTARLPQDMTPSQIFVTDPAAFTITVDRDKAQTLLDGAGRNDLVLPGSIDGAEISIEIPSSVSASFGTCPTPLSDETKGDDSQIPGHSYPDCVIFAQIPSPSVNAPAGVDVAQLAQIALEFTGMTREEAAELTSTIDWTSTLVVPIPRHAATYEQVEVDGVTGTLIQRSVGDEAEFALLWVKDEIVYTISGQGTNSEQAIEMANSLP
jgi:hypothetical protein